MAPSDSVWYAALTAEGIGRWNLTTSYPSSVVLPSCSASGSDVYCVGGTDQNGNPVNSAFYASLSPDGVGQWIPTTAYPLPATGQSCGASGGYVYCVGGASTGGQTISYSNAVYYAKASSTGVGTWGEAPDYPRDTGTNCAVTSGYIYCVGGFDDSAQGENDIVNYAPLGSLTA